MKKSAAFFTTAATSIRPPPPSSTHTHTHLPLHPPPAQLLCVEFIHSRVQRTWAARLTERCPEHCSPPRPRSVAMETGMAENASFRWELSWFHSEAFSAGAGAGSVRFIGRGEQKPRSDWATGWVGHRRSNRTQSLTSPLQTGELYWIYRSNRS